MTFEACYTENTQAMLGGQRAEADAEEASDAAEKEAKQVNSLNKAEERMIGARKEIAEKLKQLKPRSIKLCKDWARCSAWSSGGKVALFSDMVNSLAWHKIPLRYNHSASKKSLMGKLAWFATCPARASPGTCEKQMLDWDGLV